MKVAILAGGAGSRLAEETRSNPKPLVEIGGKPILWHILQYCSHFGLNEFVIALGYKGEMIKRYFADLSQLGGDIRVNFADGTIAHSAARAQDWQVDLVDTGAQTMTGGRIKRLAPYLDNEPFLLLWSDGLFDVDLSALIAHHHRHRRLATMVVVSPPSRFGHALLDGDQVVAFEEKPVRQDEWINAGVFVLEPPVTAYVADDSTQWERQPLHMLANEGQLTAYRHRGYWQCMDTLNDRRALEEAWQSGAAPWNVWS
jgi:glucose-1-phosphate cytidylyltransferase